MNKKSDRLIDFQSICRICLDENSKMVSIFEKHLIPNYKSYSEMLEECTSVVVSADDILPKNLCNHCSEQLVQSYKLKIQCLTSEKMLLQFIENASEIKIEIDEPFVYNVKPIFEDDNNIENTDDFTSTEIKVEYLEDFESNKQIYECNDCSIEFSSESEHTNHIKLMHSKLKCEYCIKEFSNVETLKKHLNSIHQFCCKVCSKIFTNEIELKQHINANLCTSHPFTCDKCDKTFKNSTRYKIHMRIHTGDKRYLCTYCGKSFTDGSNLAAHIRIHTGEKRYKCKICGVTFVQGYSLRSHLITHSQEKNYECKICNKRFSRTNGLRRHILTHSGEKNYVCDICNKRFLDQHDLKYHKKFHTGERNHSCTLCNKAFTQSTHLRTHLRIHTGEKPFICAQCGKQFRQKQSLNIHNVKVHQNDLTPNSS